MTNASTTAPRFHVPLPLAEGGTLLLPPAAARHAQVLRLQPGDAVVLFDGGSDCEWQARVAGMGRDSVTVEIETAVDVRRELLVRVTIAVGMPANDRMDALIEKATELGVSDVLPLVCARSVLRLDGRRAEARQQRWQAIAASASEQCGRTRVPKVAVPAPFAAAHAAWAATGARWVLSLHEDAVPLIDAGARLEPAPRPGGNQNLVVLSGPEGGLAPEEEAAARTAGFVPVGLGPRVLRADTAPLAVLAYLGQVVGVEQGGSTP